MYDEFICLFLGKENHQNLWQLFDIFHFGAVSRAKKENLGSSTVLHLTGAQALATRCRHTGGSMRHVVTTCNAIRFPYSTWIPYTSMSDQVDLIITITLVDV